MQSEVSPPAQERGKVFISYAHEDAVAAGRIADALRSAGIDVWFDAGELRGGDIWDRKIRQQIRDCALLIAVISSVTQARSEGYFRREWKMAVDRVQDMSENRAFIVPVLIDATLESSADVPDQFLKSHFARLPGGAAPPEFVEHIRHLLESPRAPGAAPHTERRRARSTGIAIPAIVVAAIAALGAFFWTRPAPLPSLEIASTTPQAATVAKAPEAKSIAVLPFADMSESKDQEYMSDGLAEELLNLLARIPALQVTSRTSAFSFKGKNLEVREIGKRLNVAHVLEGSVRKSGNRMRITAQLIDARTDTHVWSETYDRKADDIFAVQDEIAEAVVRQLKVTLLGTAPKAREADPRAYALFLKAREAGRVGTAMAYDQSIALYREAIAIDPAYAAAWAALGSRYIGQANKGLKPIDESYRRAREALDKALTLDPELASAHTLLSRIASDYDSDLGAAARHLERAMSLEPTTLEVIGTASGLAQNLGRFDRAIELDQYALKRDPLNPTSHGSLAYDYARTARLDEAIVHYEAALRLSPDRVGTRYNIGEILLRKGEAAKALAEMEREAEENWRLQGLTMAQHALGRKAQSDAALAELIRKYEKESAYNIAYVVAFRGEKDRAFEWLDKAVAYHDTGLVEIASDPMFASLRDDPRWLPFLRKLGKSPEQLAAIRFDVRAPAGN